MWNSLLVFQVPHFPGHAFPILHYQSHIFKYRIFGPSNLTSLVPHFPVPHFQRPGELDPPTQHSPHPSPNFDRRSKVRNLASIFDYTVKSIGLYGNLTVKTSMPEGLNERCCTFFFYQCTALSSRAGYGHSGRSLVDEGSLIVATAITSSTSSVSVESSSLSSTSSSCSGSIVRDSIVRLTTDKNS